MKSSRAASVRRVAFFLLRVALAVVLLGWLVRSGRLDLAALASLRPDAAQWGRCILAAAAVGAGLCVLGARLRWLLAAVGLAVPFPRALRVTVLGSLFGTLLPGLVGGDLVKAAALCKDLPSGRRAAVGTVMADRLVGLYALFALATLGVLIGRSLDQLAGLPSILLAVPPVVVVGAPLALVLGRLAGDWFASRFPSRWTERIEPLLASLRVLAGSPGLLVGATALGMVNHALVIGTFVAAGDVLAVPLRLVDHGILDPLALALNAVPFSPGGLGLAEGAFSYLYELLGTTQGAAVGVVGRAIQYVVYAIAGLLALILPDRSGAGRSERAEGAP